VPKYNVKVNLQGCGHGFDVIERVRTELRANAVPDEEITRFTGEAIFGNYSHLLLTCMDWVKVS
jgi:hypothetical protein